MSLDILVLAAGTIRDKIHFLKYVFNSPALIPLNTRSLASCVIDFYLEQAPKGSRIHLVINKADEAVVRRELGCYGSEVNYILVENSKGVIDTLSMALPSVDPKGETIVNIVASIPSHFASSGEVLLANRMDRSRDWSSINPDLPQTKFIPRGSPGTELGYAFTGIFRTQAAALAQVVGKMQQKDDLISVVRELAAIKPFTYTKGEWLDCGHESHYYRTKSSFIASRSFNRIFVDETAGIITKSSSDVEKFQNEIGYISMLPRETSIYFPRIVDALQVHDGRASVRMEYYGYPTLAEYMLYWNLEEGVWEKIFGSIEYILKHFRKYRYSIGQEAFRNFYFDKTVERVAQFRTQAEKSSPDLFKDKIRINGRDYASFESLKGRIEKKVAALYRESDFGIMHGDFCFNNILHDIYSGVTRLIDARGSFGSSCVGIYGDIKYDLAKLTHSCIGGYDYLVNRAFSLKREGGAFSYEVFYRENHASLVRGNELLLASFGYPKQDILFIVGLLFVSMCPLHSENIDKQTVMYLHGLKFINEALEAT